MKQFANWRFFIEKLNFSRFEQIRLRINWFKTSFCDTLKIFLQHYTIIICIAQENSDFFQSRTLSLINADRNTFNVTTTLKEKNI